MKDYSESRYWLEKGSSGWILESGTGSSCWIGSDEALVEALGPLLENLELRLWIPIRRDRPVRLAVDFRDDKTARNPILDSVKPTINFSKNKPK